MSCDWRFLGWQFANLLNDEVRQMTLTEQVKTWAKTSPNIIEAEYQIINSQSCE